MRIVNESKLSPDEVIVNFELNNSDQIVHGEIWLGRSTCMLVGRTETNKQVRVFMNMRAMNQLIEGFSKLKTLKDSP
jgi:hypothetical protein